MKKILSILLFLAIATSYGQVTQVKGIILDTLTTTELNNLPSVVKVKGAYFQDRTLESLVTWNGSEWVVVGGAPTTDASDLTDGVLADARVQESNVTQHEGALSITENQISDFGSYLPLSGGSLSGFLAMNGNPLIGMNFANAIGAFSGPFYSIGLYNGPSDNRWGIGKDALGLNFGYQSTPWLNVLPTGNYTTLYTMNPSGTPTTNIDLVTKGYADANYSGGGGASQLSDLSDVGSSTPTNRNVLVADGTNWESRPLVEADISNIGSYVNTSTFQTIGGIKTFTSSPRIESGTSSSLIFQNTTSNVFPGFGFGAIFFGENEFRVGTSNASKNNNVLALNTGSLTANRSLVFSDSDITYNGNSLIGGSVPLGGTTGQVLAKASGTDYDTEWVDQSGGDNLGDHIADQDLDISDFNIINVDSIKTNATLVFHGPTRSTGNFQGQGTGSFTNGLSVGNSSESINTNYISIRSSTLPTSTENGGVAAVLRSGTDNGEMVWYGKSGVGAMIFDNSNITTAKTYTMPNTSGTVALVSNLPSPSSGTSTTIPMNNPMGYYGNMAAASSATTYTITGSTLGAWAKVRINAATQPTVTGATLIAGAAFEANVDMYMVVQYNGQAHEYYFLKIAP